MKNDGNIQDYANISLYDKSLIPQTTAGTINITQLLNNGKLNNDISNYLNGPNNQGLFQKSTNPNGPLFETRSQFIDKSKFLGSDYFYDKIGLDLEDLGDRLIGDQVFQSKLIEEQIKSIAKDSFLLSQNEVSVYNETQALMDNAADEYERLGLDPNKSLTQEQIDSLQKDMLWYEIQETEGGAFLVPVIYLTKETRENLKNNDSIATGSTIFAKGSVILTASEGSVTNQGSIIANDDVTITAKNDITNENFSNITATNGNLELISEAGSIINKSELESTLGQIYLEAANDITNTATVQTNAKNLLDTDNPAYVNNALNEANSGNIESKLIEEAKILAGTNVTIKAGSDFNNYGSDITTAEGNLDITAGDDINIETVQLRDRTERRWKSKKTSHELIIDTTKNVGSDIEVGGNLI